MNARARGLAGRLGSRDTAVLTSLREFRLMTGNQIRRLHFPIGHVATQSRKARAVLQRLTELGVTVQLRRRVGGVRAGSEGHTYGLSGLGHAVLDVGHETSGQRHRRVPETKVAFADHVLAVGELAVCLAEQARHGICTVEAFHAEPRCWRWFGGIGGGQRVLKPDAYLRLGIEDYELAAFVEMDLDTESLPTISRKLGVYVDYWRTGVEQHAYGVFPRVWWLVPDHARFHGIVRMIQRIPAEAHNLFTVALTPHAPDLLTQLPEPEGGAQ